MSCSPFFYPALTRVSGRNNAGASTVVLIAIWRNEMQSESLMIPMVGVRTYCRQCAK
jgi:hypothetical protein